MRAIGKKIWAMGVAACLATVCASTPMAAEWKLDSAHTSAGFAVRHLMVSTVRGSMGEVSGVVKIDEQDLLKSSVEATIDVAGINTGSAKRDEHLRGPDFFDVAKFPKVTFKSKSLQQSGEGRFKLTGDLTMHGVTKEIVLDIEGSPVPMKDPFGMTRIGGVARTKINRQDFGVSWSKALDGGGLAVGNEIDVTIDVELTRAAGS